MSIECGCGLSTSRAKHRCREMAGWLVPTAILAFLPKCPACLALYLALGTGIGISVQAAGYFRTLIVLLCVGTMVYVAARRLQRALPLRRVLRLRVARSFI